jgi:adenine/guanine phosphoribosyltransferase-like PRPP-binding protein
MDPNLAIGAGSLLFTIIGTVATVYALRHGGDARKIEIVGAINEKPALRVLRRKGVGSRNKEAAIRVLARFVFVSHEGRVIVGALDQFHISLFLDLFSAATFAGYRRILARLIVDHVRGTHLTEPPNLVAVAKEGNVLLAAEVARQMKVPVVVVRTITPAIRFGDPVEGMIAANACVIVVDDIAYDGEMLQRVVSAVRAHGARISNCFCAIERLDGNGRAQLAGHSVNLHAPIQLDEKTLRELANLPPEAVA